jgi:hypothetical protein
MILPKFLKNQIPWLKKGLDGMFGNIFTSKYLLNRVLKKSIKKCDF